MGKHHTIIRFCCVAALAMCTSGLPLKAERSVPADTMRQVVVTAPLTRDVSLTDLCPVAHTTLRMADVEKLRVTDVKELSALVPNLHIPDYGARMTSSVYIRGLGSRIDQPAMGVYVDGIPLLNKNTFDFPLLDVRNITVLRGPQNTLYGRNAMGGVMDVQTLSPLSYEGTRLMVEGGNGNNWRGQASTYRRINDRLGFSVAAQGSRSDGFYTNAFRHAHCDWSRSAGLNLRLEGRTAGPDEGLHWNMLSALDWVNQGGFPYRLLDVETGVLHPVAYNDHCGYNRLVWRLGAMLEGVHGKLRYKSATAYQFSDDDMQMDQDFTPRPMFTLRQAQQDHTLNQDFTLRPRGKELNWDWLTGVNLWFRNLATDAPVHFGKGGIDELIVGHANDGIHQMSPKDTLSMDTDHLPILSNFVQRYYGLALYHHSALRLTDHWKLAIGARAEYEGQHFRYNSRTQVHYHISSPDGDVDRTPTVGLYGTQGAHYFEWAPKVSLTYENGHATWHVTASRGFKAGGFNTQLFSDMTQQLFIAEIMRNYVAVDDDMDVRAVTRYKPEHSWNAETGLRWQQGGTQASATVYFTDCRNQQLTVFPDGMQTGRMMTNAGHSRIYGAEVEARHHWHRLAVQASYGYTHAVFADFPDGNTNHRGKFIPYVPQHTLMAGADWDIPLKNEDMGLSLHADTRAVGPLFWDEENTARQNFYAQLNASVKFRYRTWTLTCWGRNLTDTSYSTFYFVSMQNRFLQQGKPLQCGATLAWVF